MKHISPQERIKLVLWLRARTRRAARRRERRRGGAIASRIFNNVPSRRVIVFRDGVRKRATLLERPKLVPTILSFRDNYEATANFLEQVREGLSSGWQAPVTSPPPPWTSPHREHRRRLQFRNYWDFTKIEMISAPVALAVASHYDVAVHRYSARPYALEYDRWHPDVRARLEQIGFLELCGVNQPGESVTDGAGWRLLKLSSGDVADGARVGELLAKLGVDTLVD